jgi:hypothetical protein
MDSESYTETLARDVLGKLFQFYSGMNMSQDEMRENLMIFVNHFTQLVIAQALQDYDPKQSKKKKMDHLKKNFSNLLGATQVQMGQAFSSAILKYAGQRVTYHCVLTTSHQPMNAMPC